MANIFTRAWQAVFTPNGAAAQTNDGLKYQPDAQTADTAAPTTKTDLLEDIVWSIGTMYSGKDFPKYNLDELQGRKGYQIYKRMMVDEQIKAVVRFKRDAITSRDWQFTCECEELSTEECAARVRIMEEAINRMEGSFSDAINNIMSAMYMGFSMTEKVLQLNVLSGKQWYGIKHLRLKPSDTFYFYLDEFGNIIKLTQRMYGAEQPLDMGKFIHYVQNPEWDLQYGRSELRECYRAYFSKDMIIKFQNIYLERFAGGFVWAQPENGKNLTPGTTEYTNLQAVLQNINTLTSAIVPQNVKLNMEHSASTNAFELAIAQADKSIAKCLLVPNLLGISEQGTHGSLAQADSQLEAFLWTLQADTARLEDCLQDQLFNVIGDLNWGDDIYPRFKFNPISDKNKMLLINTWAALVTAGAVEASDTDEDTLRDLLNMPDKGTPINTKAAPPQIDPATGKAMPQAPQSKVPAEIVPGKGSLEETVIGKQQAHISAFLREQFGYDPSQARDDHGMWTLDGLHSGAAAQLVKHSGLLADKVLRGEGHDALAHQWAHEVSTANKSLSTMKLNDANLRELHSTSTVLVQHVQGGTAQTDAAAHHALRVGTLADTINRDRNLGLGFAAFTFDPSQARDEHGMWTMVGGGAASSFAYHGSSTAMLSGQTHLKPGVDGYINTTTDIHTAEKHAHAAALIKGGDPVVARVNAAHMLNPYPQSKPTGDLRISHTPVAIHSIKQIPMAAVYGKDKPVLATRKAFDRAMKRVDFAVIANQSDSSAHTTAYDVAVINSEAVKRIADSVGDMTLADVPGIKFTPDELGRMKAAVLAGLKDSWGIGTSHATRELGKASRQKRYAVDANSLQDLAAEFMRTKAFTITGSISGQTIAAIQKIITEGIKTGKSEGDMKTAIYKRLESDGLLTDEAVQEALGTLTVQSTSARISTIIRTASFEAINEARYAFFSDPALDGFVEALEYSAVLDNVTTELCRDLDGDTYAVDDPVWDTYRPPNHYNCRSILVPVTQRDTWEASDAPTVEPSKGFGFSKLARPSCAHKHREE